MTILYVNTGSSPNRGDGDSLRTSFNKINQNFAYLSTLTSTASVTNIYTTTNIYYTTSTDSISDLMTDGVLTVPGHIIPDADLTYDLGSTSSQWRSLYVGTSTIYLGGTALSVTPDGSLTVNGDTIQGGLPTITVPGEQGSTYKGLQVSYGMIHSNGSTNELNVNKMVIHKPAATTTTIDPTSSQDDFEVSGLSGSDVLAMFVLYGDVNGPKPVSTLQAFAEVAIDTVILSDGVEGQFNTVDDMKTAFYGNYQILSSAAGGLYQDFQFFNGTDWPENSISDGGVDQYDTANFISTNLATDIAYNGGNTVADGVAAFGTGSSYSFAYNTGTFALFATGTNVTLIRTSGNSGADGNSITEAGNIYGPDTAAATYDNAVTHINFVGDPYAGPIVSFTHSDNGDEVDILIPDDGEGAGVGITRSGNGNGIYNLYREEGWSNSVSPDGTLWNTDGWSDLTNVETRPYAPLYEAFGSGGLGNKIVGTECVMYLPDNGKYYAVKFDQWTQNNQGGGFAYTRRELDLSSLSEGIRFTDGTRLKSAEGIGRVKLSSPGSRRIEEVYGYKQVSLTPRVTSPSGTTTSVGSNEGSIWQFSIVANDELLGYYNGIVAYSIEVSLDQNTWLSAYIGGGGGGNLQIVLNNGLTLSVAAETTVYYRVSTGNEPVVWWDATDLPGGSSNFRGAIIKYHAYDNNAGTMVGTIYTVDDDGDENVSHAEVFSGGGDGDTIILWDQTQEGQLKARRTNGESTTIKIQWSATVFYGSEYWD